MSELLDGMIANVRRGGISGRRASEDIGVDRDRPANSDPHHRRGRAQAGVECRLAKDVIEHRIGRGTAVGGDCRRIRAHVERNAGADIERDHGLTGGGVGGLLDRAAIVRIGLGRATAGECIGDNASAPPGIDYGEGGIAGTRRILVKAVVKMGISICGGAA